MDLKGFDVKPIKALNYCYIVAVFIIISSEFYRHIIPNPHGRAQEDSALSLPGNLTSDETYGD